MSRSLVRPVFSILGKFVVSGSPWMRSQQQHSSMHFVTSRVDYCNAVLAGSPKITTDKLQRVMNSAARVVSNTRKFDSGLSWLLHDDRTPLARCRRPSIQARPAGVHMPSWNSSAVHDGKLHANSRRRQSSTPAVRHTAEDDRSALSTGQLWSSVFPCCGPVNLEFAARQSS